MRLRAISRFLLIAAGVYLLLTLGWGGFGESYATVFRTCLRGAFADPGGDRAIEIPSDQPVAGLTRAIVVNRRQLAPDGSGPVRIVELPNSTFWQGAALLLALALATPSNWSVRLSTAVLGSLIVQAFIAWTVLFALWSEGRFVGLTSIAPQWEHVVSRLQDIFAEQTRLGAPILAWLVTAWAFLRRP